MQHELGTARIGGALLSVSRCWSVASQVSAKAQPGGLEVAPDTCRAEAMQCEVAAAGMGGVPSMGRCWSMAGQVGAAGPSLLPSDGSHR